MQFQKKPYAVEAHVITAIPETEIETDGGTPEAPVKVKSKVQAKNEDGSLNVTIDENGTPKEITIAAKYLEALEIENGDYVILVDTSYVPTKKADFESKFDKVG